MKFAKAMMTVAGLTGVSRIAGFTRDILTAGILGAGPVADAFFVALKLPNLFRRVTAEGAFSVSFVPLYAETLEKEGRETADKFASNAFTIMLGGLSVFTLIAMWVMPYVIYVIAPGFADDAVRYDLAVELTRVTFPYLLLMSLTALIGGVLNALERFAPFAFAPVLFNMTLITALLLSGLAESAGHALAWGVLISGFIQLIWLWLCARRAHVAIKLRKPEYSKRIRKVFVLMGPGVLGAGVMHINLFADVVIASMLDTGAISYLYYADRLNQLPMGMVGIAVGTALLPMLARALAAAKMDEARDLFNRALEYCLLFALPAATGLFVIGWPIVVTLFHHGAFTWEAAASTTAVIRAYCIGMPAYIAIKILATTFWAKQDTVTPVKVSVAGTLFNIGLSLWLVFRAGFGVEGIALGTALSGWLQVVLFLYYLKGREETRFDRRFVRNGLKILMACVLMAGVLFALRVPAMQFYRVNDAPQEFMQIAVLAGLVLSGMIVYSIAVLASGAVRPAQMKKYFRKEIRQAP